MNFHQVEDQQDVLNEGAVIGQLDNIDREILAEEEVVGSQEDSDEELQAEQEVDGVDEVADGQAAVGQEVAVPPRPAIPLLNKYRLDHDMVSNLVYCTSCNAVVAEGCYSHARKMHRYEMSTRDQTEIKDQYFTGPNSCLHSPYLQPSFTLLPAVHFRQTFPGFSCDLCPFYAKHEKIMKKHKRTKHHQAEGKNYSSCQVQNLGRGKFSGYFGVSNPIPQPVRVNVQASLDAKTIAKANRPKVAPLPVSSLLPRILESSQLLPKGHVFSEEAYNGLLGIEEAALEVEIPQEDGETPQAVEDVQLVAPEAGSAPLGGEADSASPSDETASASPSDETASDMEAEEDESSEDVPAPPTAKEVAQRVIDSVAEAPVILRFLLGCRSRPFRRLQTKASTDSYAKTFSEFVHFLERLVAWEKDDFELPETFVELVKEEFAKEEPDYFKLILDLLKYDPAHFPKGDPFTIFVALLASEPNAGPKVIPRCEKLLAKVPFSIYCFVF